MIRRVVAIASGALTVLALAQPVGAQASRFIVLGAGATIPMGDYGDYAKTGYMATAGVGTTIGQSGMWGALTVQYGSNSHETDGDKTNLTIGSVHLGYNFNPEAKVAPYVSGSLGMMNHAYKSESFPSAEGSETFLAYSAGVGLLLRKSERTAFWAEARYMTGSKDGASTGFVPLSVGVSINLSGN